MLEDSKERKSLTEDNSEDIETFDDVLDIIGSFGRYQKLYLVYLFCFTLTGCLFYFSYIVALSTPDHWCDVSGRNLTNFTLEEWKAIHIPKVLDESNVETFSSCKMYNYSSSNSLKNDTKPEIIDCQSGWEYDKTWYTRTIITDENWVCDKNFYATNIIAICKISEIFGSSAASYMGDMSVCLKIGLQWPCHVFDIDEMYGRNFVIVWTIVLVIIGRILMLFAAGSYYIYLISTVIGSFASFSMLLSATIIALEISGEHSRSKINMIQANGWAIGLGFTPVLMWAVRDWTYFVIISTIPCFVYIILTRYVVESPRWMLSLGKISECRKALIKMANINRTTVSTDITPALTKISKQKTVNYGIVSFFSHWRIAKTTLCVNVCWIVTGLSYLVLVLSAGNVGSNPIISGFLQGIIEIPANVLGMFACNYFGRRLSHMCSHFATIIGCIPLIFIVHNDSFDLLSTILTVFLKFAVAMTLYCQYLHTMEIYPTCLRQSGMSFGSLNSNIVSILAPYVVYASVNIDSKLPYYMFVVMALAAATSIFFLPETLHVTLPETLEEFKEFGRNQKYFQFFTKSKKRQSINKENKLLSQ